MPHRSFPRPRPRSTWIALATGIIGCLVVFGGVLLPVLGLIGTGVPFAPFVEVPVIRIGVAVIGGYALAAGLLAVAAISRSGAVSWVSSVAAVIAALVVSLYPLLAVGLAASGEVGDAIPRVLEWIGRVTNP